MSKCPKCGDTESKEWRQCPEYAGEPVCIKCCTECSHHGGESAMLPCRFYLENPKPNYEDEIRKLSSKIKSKEGIMQYLYKTNRPRAARIIENEINLLKHEKKELKEMQ